MPYLDDIYEMEKLDTIGVSLVREGANGKVFAVKKSKGDTMNMEEIKAVLDVPAENEEQFDIVMKGKAVSKAAVVGKAMMRLMSAFRDEMDDDMMAELSKQMGFPRDAANLQNQHKMEQEKQEEEDMMKKIAATKKQYDGKKDDEEDMKEDMMEEKGCGVKKSKELEFVMKEKEELVQKAKKLADELQAEKDARRQREFVTKAKEQYGHVPIAADALGTLIKHSYDSSESLGKGIEELLSKVESVVKSSNLFQETGTNLSQFANGGGAWGKIQKMAKEYTQKSDGSLSQEAAVDRVMRENPDLYIEYLNENPAQVNS